MWENLSIYRKIIFAVAVVLILSIPAVFFFMIQNDHRVLAENIEAEQLSDVIRMLDEEGIPYEFSAENGAISVQGNDLARIRMILAKNGTLESSSLGFEIFENTSYGMTEFSQRIYYQRALQGELERTIKSLEAVRRVRVHLVLPENSLFKDRQGQSKASVALSIKNSTRLSQEEVLGIQHLVAAAVPELDPDRVTVMNSSGILLSEDPSTGFRVTSKLQFKKELENYYKEKVSEIVNRIVSDENAVVLIDTSIDYSKSESTKQTAIPLTGESSGVLVRNKTNRNYDGQTKTGAGARRIDKGLVSEAVENEYQYSREMTKTEIGPGRINTITVSILLAIEVEEQKVSQLTKLVEEAIGFNPVRGDRVSIRAISPLRNSWEKDSKKTKSTDENLDGISRLSSDTESKVESTRYTSSNRPWYANLIFREYRLWFIVLTIIIALVIIGMAYTSLRRKHLSGPEKAALLEDMRIWLGESNAEYKYSKQKG
ncbi:flagellar basal-body MS-ring/collar protein FliF [Microbulbifer rhizosphaerae]|uniref:Flagellar M-ring protein n=1 Tax=Microbulbifer rhizosphaerae TaxID=1562603 RepID=A0A7W4ZBC8_9GAMM|nr:flagellar basal-body MS-ring/collar protein FliF [Microbulbifer rhizosphaerae]MBB3063491.1 flagellar M-ring protein FliF [Microbulbifer rhizosphaerae]